MEEVSITAELAETWLKDDSDAATGGLERAFPIVLELSEVRQRDLIKITVNTGINRLKRFKKMGRALEKKKYFLASLEMENSKWHRQVGKRAEELANMMKVG